jgi:hypothetical protein
MTERWEYSVVQAYWNRHTKEESITYFSPDGSERSMSKKWGLSTISSVLSQLGREGWQLVSTDAEGGEIGQEKRTLWLKRVIQ